MNINTELSVCVARRAQYMINSRLQFKLMIFMKHLVLWLFTGMYIAGSARDPLSRYRKPHPYSGQRERV